MMIHIEKGEFFITIGIERKWFGIYIHLHLGSYDKMFSLTIDPEWRNFNMELW